MNSFQSHLQAFSASVGTYDANPQLAVELVRDSDAIAAEIQRLEEKLHHLQTNTLTTSSVSSDLSETLGKILQELGDAKHALDLLPSEKSENLPPVSTEDTTEILTYALKLAKFTKLSKSLNGLVHPNNFIWPGDDALRRGNLAMMTTVGETVIALENGDEIPSVKENNANNNEEINQNIKDQIQQPSFDLPERPDSFSLPEVPKVDASNALAGLDLDMDSDDE